MNEDIEVSSSCGAILCWRIIARLFSCILQGVLNYQSLVKYLRSFYVLSAGACVKQARQFQGG